MPAADSRPGAHSSSTSAARSSSVTASIAPTISSSDSSGVPASTSEPSRFIRAPGRFEREHDSTLEVLLGAVKLLGGRGLLAQATELGPDHRQRLGHVVGARADVQPDLPGVLIGARERVDRVGQPAALADLLEQPRGRGAAEDRVEHAQREPPIVVARERRAAEADVVLLGVLALEPMPRMQLGRAPADPGGARPSALSPSLDVAGASSTIASCSIAPAAAITTLDGA